MIQKSSDTDFKKVEEPDSHSDFEEDDDDVEYVEYEINHAENCVQVIDHRRSDADAAKDKVETALQENAATSLTFVRLFSERKEPGRVREQGLVCKFYYRLIRSRGCILTRCIDPSN